MNREKYHEKIVDEFQDWFINDIHSTNMNYYNTLITESNLKSLSKKELIDFFFDFVCEGGKIQSGGERKKNLFKSTIENDIKTFKSFILEPFKRNFDLNLWFKRVDDFPGFGVGIATIYLNRVDLNKYSVMNNKTLKGLTKLGFKISSSKNWTNYQKVNKIQNELISKFSILENYYKTDALNHFIVAVYNGKELIKQIEIFEDNLEQSEIENYLKENVEDEKELYQKIKDCEKENNELITVKGKSYKRHNYLMVQIKKYRKYKCQFCSTTILKKNGDYYIEACHIKPKAEKGKDKLDNILILCPNCHKLFDYGKRENEKYSNGKYRVTLNGKKCIASIV